MVSRQIRSIPFLALLSRAIPVRLARHGKAAGLIAILSLGAATLVSASPASSPSVIHSCVKHGEGQIRILDADDTCKKNETALDWNQQGIPGPAGPQGPKGDTGASGPQGATGPQGPKGDAGATGPQGPKGDTGATGPQGPSGPSGAAGPKGDAGPAGPQGPAGPTGADGAAGPQGATGPAGAQGPAGSQGPAGPQGSQGLQGPPGASGYEVLTRRIPDVCATFCFFPPTENSLFGGVSCSAGKRPLGGGANLISPNPSDANPGVYLAESRPMGPTDFGNAGLYGWIARYAKDAQLGPQPIIADLYVICANVQ